MESKKYIHMEELMELVEDYNLGYLAKERDLNSRSTDYIPLEKVEKRIKAK